MKSGFTLIELMITITIIAILGTIAAIFYSGLQKDTRDQKRLQELRLVKQALEAYKSKYSFYPPGSNTLSQALTSLVPNYLAVLATDPLTDRNYVYKALPLDCSDTCTGFVLCAKKEGVKFADFACNENLNCGEAGACDLGLTSQ